MPKVLMIIVFVSTLILHTIKHGEKKEGEYNAWLALVSVIIEFSILWWGGFWGNL